MHLLCALYTKGFRGWGISGCLLNLLTSYFIHPGIRNAETTLKQV